MWTCSYTSRKVYVILPLKVSKEFAVTCMTRVLQLMSESNRKINSYYS